MHKLKIVHLVEALGGGVYTYFVNLTHVLAANPQFEVTVIYSDKREQIDPSRVAEDFHPNTNLIVQPMQREINLKEDFQGFKAIRNVLKNLKPDVLHVHSSKAGILGRFAYLFIKRKHTQLYYTPHGFSFLRKDVSKLKRFAFYAIEFVSQKICGGTIIACGDTELEYSKKIGPAVLIRNGINHREITSPSISKNAEIKKIGILGRTTSQRDPKLFNQLALKNPEIEFIWIGDGELRHLLTATNITITGWFKENQKGIAWLETLDVYLQTSLWEGLPIAVLEASSREIPVIATNIIGNKDIIRSGQTGYLFENTEEFQECLQALKSVEERKQIGLAAAKRNRILFDSTTNFNKLAALYLKNHRFSKAE